MDMVWLDTMFPGIDEDEGWEENMKRVVNYDYLLKEYLDWQLKHLTTDNFDSIDWGNVTADLIHLASEYTDNAVKASAELTLQAADEHAEAKLAAYYTKAESDAQAALILEAADSHTDVKLQSYYTSTEVDGAINTSKAELEAYADAAVAALNISSYYTKTEADALMESRAALALNSAKDYTSAQLTAYYTKQEIGDFSGYTSAMAALKAYADDQVANIDLSATYYDKTAINGMLSSSEADLRLYTDNKVAAINISAYYTASQVNSAINTAKSDLKLYADNKVASIDLSAYATSSDLSASEAALQAYADGKISGLKLKAVNSGGTAQLVLQSGGSTVSGSGASLGLSVSSALTGSNSTISLTSGGITLASGNIKLDGTVMFTNSNISRLNNNSGYQTSSGVTTIIGATVNTDFINALGVTAAAIRATGNKGAYVYGSTSGSKNYLLVHADGFDMYTDGKLRATLYEDDDEVTLRLGNNNYAYVQKYYSGSTHYMWIGDGARTGGVGIRFNLTNKTYHIYGTAE